MIASRDDLLKAVRLAAITPEGVVVGKCAFAEGNVLQFTKVTDETSRRRLIDRIKLAPSASFKPTAHWEIPCLEKTVSKARPGTKAKSAKTKGKAKRS